MSLTTVLLVAALILQVVELGVIIWIAVTDRELLVVEKDMRSYYAEYLSERTRWYQARGKQKASTQTTDAGVVVLPPRAVDGVREADGLRGSHSSEPRPTAGGQAPSLESLKPANDIGRSDGPGSESEVPGTGTGCVETSGDGTWFSEGGACSS